MGVACRQLGPEPVVDDVVGRGDHPREVDAVEVVAEGTEGLEAGHPPILADARTSPGPRAATRRAAWRPAGAGCHHPAVAWVLDLDGVIWLADQPIPGAREAVAALRAAGERVLFATNNSYAPLAAQEAKLERMGIPARGDVVTSAMAAATLVEPGERVLVCGGPGIREAVAARGAVPVDDGDAEAVVVGFHRDFDYERLRVATRAVQRGARLVATNDDATYPTPEGPIPGGGALVAAVAYASGAEPVVSGKPHPPMAALVREVAGTSGTVVGDRPETDGRFARALGYRFALVLSGVTREGDLPVEPAPDVVAPTLATLVEGIATVRDQP
nr:HAD-IIA family hydrolase [Thermoanaerobacterales bacterium]